MSNMEMQEQSLLNEIMCDEVGKGDELPISCLKQVAVGPQGPRGHVKNLTYSAGETKHSEE